MLKKISMLAILAAVGLFTVGCSPTPKGNVEVKDRGNEKIDTPKEEGGGAAAAIE